MECILLLRAHYLKLFIPITVLLLLSFPVLASRQEQKVTLNVINKTLKNVFHSIEEQTDVLIMYDLAVIDDNEKVSINVKEMVLEEVLNKLFYNKPVKWSKKGNVIRVFIEAPVKEPVGSKALGKPPVSISGKITDANGTPLPGATVLIKGTRQGTSTSIDGEFVLAVEEDAVLVISFIGYDKVEVSMNGKQRITVKLKPAIGSLDEAVVEAYGITTRRLTTSNIGKVTAEEIEKQPIMNPLLALQGKIAGLDVSQVNGYASAPVKVELRGRNSIGDYSSDPLYIIDGVPLTVLELSGGAYPTSNGFIQNGLTGPARGQSPLFSINPADIESISVLKDADATAIYGSRGANGVILITTKKGKIGKTQFDLRIQHGITKATRFWDMLNTQQYIQVRREAFANDIKRYGAIDGETVPASNNAYDLLNWDTTRYTNWQKVLYGGTGKSTEVQGSLSGGEANTTFRIGGGYNRTTNILAVSGADQKASLSFSLTHNSTDQRFSISLSSSYSHAQSDMINLPGIITMPPNAPPIFDKKGNLNYNDWRISGNFPFEVLLRPYTSKTNFLNSGINISYRLVKGLSISTGIGYNNAQVDQISLSPIASKDPSSNPTGSAYFGKNSNKGWIIEPQLNYDVVVGKSKLNVLLGSSVQQSSTEGLYVQGTGYTTDELLKTITNAPRVRSIDNYGEYKYAALFGRITYNWNNKYILNFNGRRDGSSKFGPGRQYGNFGAVGAAWLFSEESWFEKSLPFISFGKLRGSYGTTGSDAIGDYQYLTRWSSANLQSYNGILPIAPTQNANPNYQWEVNKKLEGAIDLGFMKDRYSLSIVYYRNRCGNQLTQFPTPAFTGFTSVAANSPALVENMGWEFTAGANIMDLKDFRWTVNVNTSFNKNKLIAYPNLASSPHAGVYEIGQPLNNIKRLHYTGVDPKTGLYTFEDKNKDGTISTSAGVKDDRYILNLTPKFFGGVSMNFNYKEFQLGLVFNIKKQIGQNALGQGGYIPGTLFNQPVSVITSNRWKNNGDISTYAAFTTVPYRNESYSNYGYSSDAGYADASYIRLSNLALSYSLPSSWIRKIGMKGCRIYMNANNLFVITKYKGVDPETQNFGGLPPTRNIVGGINLNF
ncbi:TonB-linked outer membrane protein, SusC/RagA family [Chitinophaga sp. YR573]|uniref:SusC/RagA family TonB-linked outer membrane protein n=1 Tax=Chitinophaga sp. YR573 TaxID=1881040 RepID=UPI0008BCB681|nr:SusC/RagA family TonB-linked outer membrane protein [Chitinophaga sp. YR573]SEW04728.1 TonB-linked outer membrane protein, SusC/RagA family [Chitinophaga sp. YR573]